MRELKYFNDIVSNENDGTIIGATGKRCANKCPEFPDPEMLAINVEISGNNVSFSFEADTSGLVIMILFGS